MALTKTQKRTFIDDAAKRLNASKTVVFSEFSGVTVEELKRLRRELKKSDADIKVIKKRLFNIALENLGVSFDAMSTKSQLAAVFSKQELSAIAPLIHKFSKEVVKAKKGNFAVLAAYDANEKRIVDVNEFRAIAVLPPREVLLAQVAMMLTMPLKQLMMALNEIAKSRFAGSPDSA